MGRVPVGTYLLYELISNNRYLPTYHAYLGILAGKNPTCERKVPIRHHLHLDHILDHCLLLQAQVCRMIYAAVMLTWDAVPDDSSWHFWTAPLPACCSGGHLWWPQQLPVAPLQCMFSCVPKKVQNANFFTNFNNKLNKNKLLKTTSSDVAVEMFTVSWQQHISIKKLLALYGNFVDWFSDALL